jgi:signal transduction histidine kinase
VPLYSIGIVENITEQKQAAEAIQTEQQLLRRIIDLHERDRQITAYEIHDGITQQITASLFHLEAFRRLRESDAKTADKSLETALKLISQSVDETRRLISGLRPLILDEYGVVEAIDYLVCENRERSGMQIDFHHDVRFKRLVPPLESAAFRIVQEAIANACRHSQSPAVIVELVQRDDRLHIKVQDQGLGFDPNAVEETRFGLRSIRERARLLGGRAEIQSAPGSGTSISVELPVVLRAEGED